MDREYTCCVTEHRDILEAKALYIQNSVFQELEQAIHRRWYIFGNGKSN